MIAKARVCLCVYLSHCIRTTSKSNKVFSQRSDDISDGAHNILSDHSSKVKVTIEVKIIKENLQIIHTFINYFYNKHHPTSDDRGRLFRSYIMLS